MADQISEERVSTEGERSRIEFEATLNGYAEYQEPLPINLGSLRASVDVRGEGWEEWKSARVRVTIERLDP